MLIKSTMYPSETPGAINYWDRKSARPSRVASGHQKEASVCAS
jgi:hypothetical protein